MATITLEHLGKRYGVVEVLKDINLTVPGGGFTVIVGPSGCGKSTLLRIMAGLEELSEGDVYIEDKRVTDLDPAQRGVAMVFQSYALYPHMSVAENMSFSLRMQHKSKEEISQRVRKAAEVLKIEPLLNRKPKQLSGGQRQRVAIGRAIVRDPKVFLFDEPLSNLDADLRVQMRVEIARLHERLGNTMVYVTHDQTEAMTLATQIVVMRAGIIEQVGAPITLYEDPANAFVAGFIGTPRMNFVPATVAADGKALTLEDGTRFEPRLSPGALTPGAAVSVGIRPEHVDRADLGTPDLLLSTTVEVIENLGGTSYLHTLLPGGVPFVAERRAFLDLRPGTPVQFGVRSQDVLIFDAKGGRLR